MYCYNKHLLGFSYCLYNIMARLNFFLFIEQIKYNVILTLFWKAGASCITIFLLEPQKTYGFRSRVLEQKNATRWNVSFVPKKECAGQVQNNENRSAFRETIFGSMGYFLPFTITQYQNSMIFVLFLIHEWSTNILKDIQN